MRRYWLNFLPGVTATGLLAACTAPIPPAVMIAGQAMDGISYIATGKSGADHALSAALAEDCALHRVITLGSLCLDGVAKELQTASLGGDFDGDPVGAGGGGALAAGKTAGLSFGAGSRTSVVDHAGLAGGASFSPGVGPENHSAGEPGRGGAHAAAAPVRVAWAIPPAPRTFVVLATYRVRREAEKVSTTLRDIPDHPLLRPKVVSTLDSERPVYRLVVGPLDRSGGADLRDKLARKGFAAAAVMAGCDGAVTVSCVDSN